LGAPEYLLEARTDGPLALGVAGPVGVGSTLKSPVWMTTPNGVVIASATALTSE
jgi:hypothetical protein